jgi:hypothetical protein
MPGIDPSEFDSLKAEVAALRTVVGFPVARDGAAKPRRRSLLHRGLAVLTLTGLIVAMPVLVTASHQFSDVPTSNTFHASIDNLYGARLTGGCATGKFCPDGNVTRGQMAAFLNRSLGRANGAAGVSSADWADLDDAPAGEVTLRTGGGTGGTGHVLVFGSLSAWTDENGICPCEIELWLYTPNTFEESAPMWQLIGTETVSGIYEGAVSVSHLFTVPSGTDVTFSMYASIQSQLAPSPENNAGYSYDMSAMYLPFDHNGGNPEIPEITGPATPQRPDRGG